MNSGNSNTSESHRLLHNLLDKLNLKRSDKYVALSNLSMYNNIKTLYKNIRFTISAPTWNENIIYLANHILRHIFKIIWTYVKNLEEILIIIIIIMIIIMYVSKLINRATSKIKEGYYLEILTPETMKLPGSTKKS